jgi:hypothetical protein
MKDKLKSIGATVSGLLICVVICVVVIFVTGLLIGGAGWVSDRLFPWFAKASFIAFVVLIVVILPLSAIRATRGFAAVAILCISYLFGATVWMEGLLTTLNIWGVSAVVIGLFLGGVGVVPIAMLATLFHGQWSHLGELIVLVILTFGSRFFALWLEEKAKATAYLE